MFIVKPKNSNDWARAMFILSYYRYLKIDVFSNGENTDGMCIRVEEDTYCCMTAQEGRDAEQDLRCAEMAFQAHWHTGDDLCEMCREDEISVCVDCDIRYSCDDQRDECHLKNTAPTCGHLTFVEPINSDTFDEMILDIEPPTEQPY